MIASYLAAAVRAPLRTRPNHLEAEVHFVAERDRCCFLLAALDQWIRLREPEPELAL